MPSPPKDRPSGRLGRLLAALRPSRAGPLPVQTGFPTSLADLVVKNHGRLKKQPSPSSKRGKRGTAANASPSLSPSPSPSPPPASPPAAAVSASDRPRPVLPPPALPCRRGRKGGGFGLGLGFLTAIGVVSLALLVIWSKKVVAAVTVASFSLFLLESVSVRPRPLRRRRPRPPAVADARLFLDGRGRVSPIRELDADPVPGPGPSRPSCSDSDRGSEAAEDRSGALEEPIDPKATRTKKPSWKKLIAGAKRLHRGGRKSKEADSPVPFRGEVDLAADDGTARGGNATAPDPPGSRRGGSAGQTDATVAKEPDPARGSRRGQGVQGVETVAAPAPVGIDGAAADLVEEAEQEQEEEGQAHAGIRGPALALVAVALAGLVAGKVQAVALTVLCCAFFSSARRLEVPLL